MGYYGKLDEIGFRKELTGMDRMHRIKSKDEG
jgi:hypothetical protein